MCFRILVSLIRHEERMYRIIKVKVKCSRYRPGVAQRVGRGTALLLHDRGTRRVWVVSSKPRPHFTPGKTRYPFYRRLGGPQGRSGRAENLVLTGIRSRTVQPVVSRYTDWATGPASSVLFVFNVRGGMHKFTFQFWSSLRDNIDEGWNIISTYSEHVIV